MRAPLRPRKSAFPSAFGNSARRQPGAVQASARCAPTGTTRSFEPLPHTRTSPLGRSTRSRSVPPARRVAILTSTRAPGARGRAPKAGRHPRGSPDAPLHRATMPKAACEGTSAPSTPRRDSRRARDRDPAGDGRTRATTTARAPGFARTTPVRAAWQGSAATPRGRGVQGRRPGRARQAPACRADTPPGCARHGGKRSGKCGEMCRIDRGDRWRSGIRRRRSAHRSRFARSLAPQAGGR